MRLQHLALFRGIGLDACGVILGSNLQRDSRRPVVAFPSDHHTLPVEVAPDFPVVFPRRSAAKSLSSFRELAKSIMAINEAAQRPFSL
jgi:hypothetical protein